MPADDARLVCDVLLLGVPWLPKARGVLEPLLSRFVATTGASIGSAGSSLFPEDELTVASVAALSVDVPWVVVGESVDILLLRLITCRQVC